MTVREIPLDAPLDTVWEELVYTDARLRRNDVTRAEAGGLAKVIDGLIARTFTVREGQYAAWRAELVAQAGIDELDATLDDTIEAFAADLLRAEGGDRTTPRFKRYFAAAPNEIVRLGLESELKRVRTWPASLASESEKELKAHGRAIQASLEPGDLALDERRKAAAATADHRVREIVALIEDVNGARQSLYAELIKLGQKHKLDRDWPLRFFRRGGRPARGRGTGATADTGQPASPPGGGAPQR